MQESTLKRAFVGVRNDEPGIWRLLLQCGAESTVDATSVELPTSDVPSQFDPDNRDAMSKEEYQTLVEPFWDFYTCAQKDFFLSSGLPQNLFDYLFERAAASDKRIPSQCLYNFASGIRGLKFSVRCVSLLCGRPGFWLNQNGPTNKFGKSFQSVLPLEIFGTSPDEAETFRVWNGYSGRERVVVFEQIRKSDPTLAYKLLRKGRSKLTTETYESCLKTLQGCLDDEDLDYLQNQKKKSSLGWGYSSTEVVLCDLLARMPTSDYAQSALETARSLLTDASRLAQFDSEIKKSTYFCGTIWRDCMALGNVPLERREEILSSSPREIYARFLETRGRAVVLLAQLRSFALFGASEEQFDVCCEAFRELYQFPAGPRGSREWYGFTPVQWHTRISDNPFVQSALALGRADYFQRLRSFWNPKIPEFGKRFDYEYDLLQAAFQFSPVPGTRNWRAYFARR